MWERDLTNMFDEFSNISYFTITVGLIIDAFGELRDQQEQVKEDMEVLFSKVEPSTYCHVCTI